MYCGDRAHFEEEKEKRKERDRETERDIYMRKWDEEGFEQKQEKKEAKIERDNAI